MFRLRSIVAPAAVGLVVLVGCSVEVDDPNGGSSSGGSSSSSGGGSASGDGTVAVAASRASALLTGTFEGDIALSGSFTLTLGGQARTVVMSPDRTFVVRDVPQGDVDVSCGVAGISGSLRLPDVKAGEQIFLSVRLDGVAVRLEVTSREAASEPPREVSEPKGDALVIAANNICYFLKPGVYERDIEIRGNHVSLFGATGCGASERSILRGELRVKGNRATVHDVDLEGSVVVEGNAARIEDSCSKCWATSCYGPGKGSGGGNCGSSSTCQDGSAPPPPPADAGSDATTFDGGPADAAP